MITESTGMDLSAATGVANGGYAGWLTKLAWYARSPDRVLALLDPLLSRAALIVERNHPLGGAAQVGDNEPDPRVQLTGASIDRPMNQRNRRL